MSTARRVVGCMSGTSLDGLDAALVEIEGRGPGMRARFVRGRSAALGEAGEGLRGLAEGKAMTAREIAGLSREFSLLHARLVRGLLEGEACGLVCAHGQTLFHAPPVSWQLFNPAVLAAELGVEVVSDLRALDLAHGGQGAPITPVADAVLYRDASPCCVVNLGGFCNVTRLPAAPSDFLSPGHRGAIAGFDVCACNQLLDGAARALLGREFDEAGRAAQGGCVDPEAFASFVAALEAQSRDRRSLGTGDELKNLWGGRPGLGARDVLRTLCAAVAETICRHAEGTLILAGGGARNSALVEEIRSRRLSARLSAEVGLPGEWREASGFAVLGALSKDGVAITLPSATGVRNPGFVSGSWTGGPGPEA